MNANKIPIIAVVGPTASGKSELAVELAMHFDAEVLSFDSMQIYKGMDISTAKPTEEEMRGVPHHMIGEVDDDVLFSVAMYKKAADRIIADITSRGKRVVMVGGTGLYLDTVINNIELLEDSGDSDIRRRLKEELRELGSKAMHDRLSAVDPQAARSIHPNNTSRVIRALEVYESTGHTISYQARNSKRNPSAYDPVYIGLNAKNRDYLYDRINARVDMMLARGLLDEAEEFVNSSKKNDAGTSRQAIGLKELAPYIEGRATLEECVSQLKQETRRYAKRQLTWFRRNKEVNWLYIDELTKEELIKNAIDIVNAKFTQKEA